MSIDLSTFPKPTYVEWSSGLLKGEAIEESRKTLGQLPGLFHDCQAWSRMDPEIEVYRVQFWRPVPDGTTGGLFWGTSTLNPGRVGDEYFMTHGHFHSLRDRAELYATVSGVGALLLMGEEGETCSQTMIPGSVHYVPGNVAHRVVNTGSIPLVFLASWPSDAGHDYQKIGVTGFSKRMVARDGIPCLI
jgi:glucose-6-phosphate isomerase